MSREGQRVDLPNASGGAFPVIVLLVLVGALAAAVAGGVRIWANRSGRTARAAVPAADELTGGSAGRRRWPGMAPTASEPAAPPAATSAEASEPAIAPPAPAADVSAPAPQQAPPPAAKRSDVSPAALAAERSRIALAELGPRQDRLVQSGALPAGAAPQWRSEADALHGELGKSLIANAGVRVSDVSCFRAGCLFSFDAYDDAAEVQARARLKAMLRGETATPFLGDSFVSGLVTRPDGYLRTTVLLYAPDGAKPQ